MEELGSHVGRQRHGLAGVASFPRVACVPQAGAVLGRHPVEVLDGGGAGRAVARVPAPAGPAGQSQKFGTDQCLAEATRVEADASAQP